MAHKVMAIWPGIYLGFETLGKGFEQSSINHGLSHVSASLKNNGYGCFCVDMRSFKGWEQFDETIPTLDFDSVVIGFLSVDSVTADRAIRIVKKHFPNKKVIAGGVHLTFNQITEFSLADTVVWGEGDEVILDIMKVVSEGGTPPRHVVAPVIKDLDSLPLIDRSLFNYEYEKQNPFLTLGKPFYTFNFSRGCAYSCSFCLESKNLLWKGQRVRSPEHCVDELSRIIKGGGGIGGMMIHDDNFPSRRKWIEKFVQEWDKSLPRIPWWCQMRADFICKNEDLIEELARLGMTWCSIGIEGSQRMLDFYNKKVTVEQVVEACNILHSNDINIFGNYIMGAPTETPQDIEELGKVLNQIRPLHHSSSTYTAYPGSVLYDYCVENNLLVGDGINECDHYSMTRYPYERKIVGVDYGYIRAKQSEFSSMYAGVLRQYKKKFKTQVPVELVMSTAQIKNETPKVSVITLSHNRPGFLSEAINSVLAQTMPNWELIIIDDFSTDPNVLPVLEKAAKDPRINVFRANYDVDNISLLWNRGIDVATGEYIALLDDDNRKKPTFCEEMSNYLDTHPEHDAVACFNQVLQLDGSQRTEREEIFDAPKYMTRDSIRAGNQIDSGCMMFRRSVVEKIGWFDERLTAEDDWDFVIRLVYESKGFGIIEKPLAEYRWHSENRIYRSSELGIDTTHHFILHEKSYGAGYRILLYHQQTSKITLSQNNVLRGVVNALKSLSFATVDVVPAGSLTYEGYDLVIVFMPFSIDINDIMYAKHSGKKMITYNCEDPAAIHDNLTKAHLADYIFTNDVSVIPDYSKVIGKSKVGYCPSVSLDSIGLVFRDNVPKKYDTVFYGYAYESRIKFVKELISKSAAESIVVVGGGWRNTGIRANIIDELSEQASLELMEESKIVVLYNRQHSDLGGRKEDTVPQSVVRGYFECASGSLIMLDNARAHHNFDGEVVFYSNTSDLIKKIGHYLSNDSEREQIGRKAKNRALKDFTYEKRITALVNAVRSERYFYEVK